jgi:hypothetical protein
VAKTLSLGEYEFVEAWREGSVKYVKLKTKPDFARWVRATRDAVSDWHCDACASGCCCSSTGCAVVAVHHAIAPLVVLLADRCHCSGTSSRGPTGPVEV